MSGMVADIDEMSVKELKALIKEAGLSAVGLAEKSELREKAREARSRLAQRKEQSEAPHAEAFEHPWQPRFEYVNCGGQNDAELVVVLFHGIGATKDDLVPVAQSLAPGLRGVKCAFVFPGAPKGQWWELNPAEWMRAVTSEAALAKLIRTEFKGLPDCRAQGEKFVDDLTAKFPRAKLVLGGFSQGAMTATDLALRKKCAAILHLSGAPIVVEDWAAKLKAMTPSKPLVYISHGRNDYLLPFSVSGWTQTLFENGGCDVTYRPHDGLHDVGPLEPIAGFLLKAIVHSSA